MIKHLQYDYPEPMITTQEYEELEDVHKGFFKEYYLTHYPCELCENECSPEIIEDDGKLFYTCESGFLSLPQEISRYEVIRYKLSLKQLFAELCLRNKFDFKMEELKTGTFLVGKDAHRKYFYVCGLNARNLSTQVHFLSEYFNSSMKNVLITPVALHLSKKDLAFLDKYNCQLLELKSIVDNDFVVSLQRTESPILIVDANKRSVLINQTEISFGRRIKQFKLIYELAINSQEKVSSEILSGYKKAHFADKTPSESARKAKERLIRFLKEELLKQERDISILQDLITSFNDEGSYCLNIEPDKVQVIGSFNN